MTCMNEKHWDDYDPGCNPCQNELREYIKRGTITQKQYDDWLTGKLKFPLRKQKRQFVQEI